MSIGNQWWFFKFLERLNILWLEEIIGDDEGVLFVCSSYYSKNFYKIILRLVREFYWYQW